MKRTISILLSLLFVFGAFVNYVGPISANASNNYDYSNLDPNQYMCNIIANHNYVGKLNDYGKASNPVAEVFDMYLSNDYQSCAHITASSCADDGFYATNTIYNLLTGKMIDQTVALEDYYATILINILQYSYNSSYTKEFLNTEILSTTTEVSDAFCDTISSAYEDAFIGFNMDLSEIYVQDLSASDFDRLAKTYIRLEKDSSLWDVISQDTNTVSSIIGTAINLSEAVQRLSYYSIVADFSDATKTMLYQIYDNCPSSNTPFKQAAWKIYKVYADDMSKSILSVIEIGESLIQSGIEIAIDVAWGALLGPLSAAVTIGGAIGTWIGNFCFATDDVNEQLLTIVCIAEFEKVMRTSAKQLIETYKSDPSLKNAQNMKESLYLLLCAYKMGGNYTIDFWHTAYTGGFVSNMVYGSREEYPELIATVKSKNENVKMSLLSLDSYSPVFMIDCPSLYDKYLKGNYTTAPGRAEYFGGSLYRLFDESMTWTQAKEKCESIGGHLVTISSQEEQDFLTSFVSSSNKKSIWIGARTNLQQYYWLNGEVFDYTNWDAKEPNNLKLNQYTAMMYTDKSDHTPGTWNDENENGTNWDGYRLSDFGFICEWDINNELYVSSNSTYFDGSVYKIFDNSISWKEAAAHCAAAGGHLATITSKYEQEVLTELSYNSSKKNLWIGARTDGKSYYWTTGEDYSYTNWDINEPNNIDLEQYTAMMYTHNSAKPVGKWNDENEFGRDYPGYELSEFGYLCEWEIGIDYSLSPVVSTSSFESDCNLDELESLCATVLESDYSTGIIVLSKNSTKTNSTKLAPKKTLTVKANDNSGEVLDVFYLNNNASVPSNSFLIGLEEIAKYKEKTDNIYIEVEDEGNDVLPNDVQYVYLGNIDIPIMGDADGDEVISIMDATIIQTHLAGLFELDINQLDLCDVEGDGFVTILDASHIQMSLVDIENNCVVGEAIQSRCSFNDVVDLYTKLETVYKKLGMTGKYTSNNNFINAGNLLTEYRDFIKDQTKVRHIEVSRAYKELSSAYDSIKNYSTTINIYFSNNRSWTSVYVYLWNSKGLINAKWPGEKMTYVGLNEHNEKVYRYTVETDKYDHIIFSNNLASKTEDLVLTNKNNQGFYTVNNYTLTGNYLVYPCQTYTYK